MHEEGINILKYNQDYLIIYAETESLLEKIPASDDNNPEESSTTKKSKHTACGYSLFAHCLLDSSKKKLNFYRNADCMKKVCAALKEHATEIISYEKKEMPPLTDKEIESYSNQKFCHSTKKKFQDDSDDDSDGEKFRARKYQGNTVRFDYVNDDCYDHDDDSDNEKLDVRKFLDNTAGLDDVDDDCYEYDNDSDVYSRKFHDDAKEPHINYDYDDDVEINSIRFHSVSKNYKRAHERVHDYYLCTSKCR